MGGCLTADSAHCISVGLETLALRMERACNNALKLAAFLSNHSRYQRYTTLVWRPIHNILGQDSYSNIMVLF